MNTHPELTTIAMLQARIDTGSDYLSLFLPLAIDCARDLDPDQPVSIAEFQGLLESRYKLRMSPESARVLLGKCSKQGAIRRDGNAFFVDTTFQHTQARPSHHQQSAIDGYLRLGARYSEFTKSEYGEQIDEGDAAAEILSFLTRHQVPLLVDAALERSLRALDGKRATDRRIARFVLREIEVNPDSRLAMQRLTQGIVIKQALQLDRVSQPAKRVRRLVYIVDGPILMGALGYEGEPTKIAARSFLSLLKDSGGELWVLEPTVNEIYRVLLRMEELFKTPAGLRDVRPTPLGRNFLRLRYQPSDIARERAGVRRGIEFELGLNIRERPDHVPDYTEDEMALARALADRHRHRDPLHDPRVLHDIDCIAAALTLRAGVRPQRLDDARALFVTRSAEVYRNATGWWRDQGNTGIPPIAHQLWLGSVLWLKLRKPIETSGNYPLLSLVSMCESALRPSPKIWQVFQQRLDALVHDKKLTSDEAVAVLCSELTDDYLSRAQDEWVSEGEPDADTVVEIVYRVRKQYAAEAEEKSLELTKERAARSELLEKIVASAKRAARWQARGAFAVVACAVSFALAWSAGLVPMSGWMKLAAQSLTFVIAAGGTLWGLHARGLYGVVESRLSKWHIKRVLR